jgi:hypothetical protein
MLNNGREPKGEGHTEVLSANGITGNNDAEIYDVVTAILSKKS